MHGAGTSYRQMMYRINRGVEDFAQNWMTERIAVFEREIDRQAPENAEELLKLLLEYKSKIKDLVLPDLEIE